ncbi:hypothetical protein BC830DRAFT_1155887 [Chytriomyces sp. MP71]|nr:hypothetical protein BC830DRAFT_1155887 [Chytriomyces sp. MP71]
MEGIEEKRESAILAELRQSQHSLSDATAPVKSKSTIINHSNLPSRVQSASLALSPGHSVDAGDTSKGPSKPVTPRTGSTANHSTAASRRQSSFKLANASNEVSSVLASNITPRSGKNGLFQSERSATGAAQGPSNPFHLASEVKSESNGASPMPTASQQGSKAGLFAEAHASTNEKLNQMIGRGSEIALDNSVPSTGSLHNSSPAEFYADTTEHIHDPVTDNNELLEGVDEQDVEKDLGMGKGAINDSMTEPAMEHTQGHISGRKIYSEATQDSDESGNNEHNVEFGYYEDFNDIDTQLVVQNTEPIRGYETLTNEKNQYENDSIDGNKEVDNFPSHSGTSDVELQKLERSIDEESSLLESLRESVQNLLSKPSSYSKQELLVTPVAVTKEGSDVLNFAELTRTDDTDPYLEKSEKKAEASNVESYASDDILDSRKLPDSPSDPELTLSKGHNYDGVEAPVFSLLGTTDVVIDAQAEVDSYMDELDSAFDEPVAAEAELELRPDTMQTETVGSKKPNTDPNNEKTDAEVVDASGLNGNTPASGIGSQPHSASSTRKAINSVIKLGSRNGSSEASDDGMKTGLFAKKSVHTSETKLSHQKPFSSEEGSTKVNKKPSRLTSKHNSTKELDTNTVFDSDLEKEQIQNRPMSTKTLTSKTASKVGSFSNILDDVKTGSEREAATMSSDKINVDTEAQEAFDPEKERKIKSMKPAEPVEDYNFDEFIEKLETVKDASSPPSAYSFDMGAIEIDENDGFHQHEAAKPTDAVEEYEFDKTVTHQQVSYDSPPAHPQDSIRDDCPVAQSASEVYLSELSPNKIRKARIMSGTNSEEESEEGYIKLIASLRKEITELCDKIGLRDDSIGGLKHTEIQLLKTIEEANSKGDLEKLKKMTRVSLDRQKKAFQILVAKLRREIRRLRFQRNSTWDPIMEVKFFPYLPRTAFSTNPRTPPIGIIGNLPQRTADYFALNPPPPTGVHGESGNRWWWGSGPNLNGSLPATPEPKIFRNVKQTGCGGSTKPLKPSTAPEQRLPPISNRSKIPIGGIEQTKVGDRVCVEINGRRVLGMVKYVGIFDPHPLSGLWCGIKLDRPCQS